MTLWDWVLVVTLLRLLSHAYRPYKVASVGRRVQNVEIYIMLSYLTFNTTSDV
jgi:hypothetical protein